jgi:hypothetical protein
MKRVTKYPLTGLERVRGTLIETKVFPPCNPGLSDLQFSPTRTKPPRVLTPKNLVQWGDYYCGLVEYYVAVLNGLQFDLDLDRWAQAPPAPQQARSRQELFRKIIEQFAAALIRVPGADPANPQELVWPLAGMYEFRYRFGCNLLVLSLFFECNPDHYLVTNASIAVSLQSVGQPKAMSRNVPSSPPVSSYLCISSSSPKP